MVSPDAPRLSGRSNPRSASDVDAWWADSDTAVDSVRNYVQRDEADLVRLKETHRRPELAALDIATDAATNHGCCGLALVPAIVWHRPTASFIRQPGSVLSEQTHRKPCAEKSYLFLRENPEFPRDLYGVRQRALSSASRDHRL